MTLTLWPAFAGEDGIQLSVERAERALCDYWGDGVGSGRASQGPDYYSPPRTPMMGHLDYVDFHDIAWAVLLAGQPRGRAAQALLRTGPHSIESIPSRKLADLSDDEVSTTAARLWELQNELSGFRTAMITKVVHPKRRATVPVIDNQSFFGSYGNPAWTRFGSSSGQAVAKASRLARVASSGSHQASYTGKATRPRTQAK